MNITYEMTEEDYIRFNLYHMENSPSQQRLYRLARYILPLASAGIVYAAGVYVLNQPAVYWLVIAVLFLAIWIITYPKQHKKTIQKQLKKMLQEGDNSSLFGKKTLQIKGDAIEVMDVDSIETLSKRNVKSVHVYDDMVVVYISAVSAHIIPTRYLTVDTQAELVEVLKSMKEAER